jgi:hypothetical protein
MERSRSSHGIRQFDRRIRLTTVEHFQWAPLGFAQKWIKKEIIFPAFYTMLHGGFWEGYLYMPAMTRSCTRQHFPKSSIAIRSYRMVS